jgi:hypothetical protein
VDPLTAAGATDRAQHVAGLERINARALAQLSAADRATVMAQAHTQAGSQAAYNALARPAKAKLLASVLRAHSPALVLGDPALINTGPRPATADAANLATLVTDAASLIGIAIGGARDNDLRDVFGAAHVATAKARYTAALNRMNHLHTNNRIVTDRSGYNAEVGLGGLTNANQIALSPSAIDNPAVDENVVLLIHEAMHAGTPSIRDHGYRNSPSFVNLEAATKLDNAAHYEVVPRRVRNMAFRFSGTVFVPAGTSVNVGGVTHTAPPLTDLQQASRNASEKARAAWNMGLNMHMLWVRIYRNRGDWNGLSLPATYSGATASRFADCMPYWSKVQGLTVHDRPGLSAAGASASTAPVTQVDVALSEGLVRLISQAKNTAASQLGSQASATALLNANTSAAERAAATTIPLKTELLLTALRRVVGTMTGAEDRDVRVINAMAAAGRYAQMLTPRAPSAFP